MHYKISVLMRAQREKPRIFPWKLGIRMIKIFHATCGSRRFMTLLKRVTFIHSTLSYFLLQIPLQFWSPLKYAFILKDFFCLRFLRLMFCTFLQRELKTLAMCTNSVNNVGLTEHRASHCAVYNASNSESHSCPTHSRVHYHANNIADSQYHTITEKWNLSYS